MAPGTQRKSHIPYQRLDDVFAYQASQHPHDPAILAPGRPFLSYRRLRQHLVDMARQLQHMGLERHDRIAVVLPPSAEMAVAFLSVALRATCAPLNPNYSAQEFAFYLERLRATALIVQAGQPTPARTVALAQGLSIIELTPLSQEAAGLFTLSPGSSQDPRLNVSGEAAQPDDVALVLHTSGTTSTPKVIPLTHSQICAGAHHTATALGLTSRDCCLNIVPLFHTYGLVATTLASLMVGACVAIPGAFEVDHFFAWIDRFQPTWYPGVPAMHRAILSQSEAYRDVIDRCSLRFIRSAAAPLPQHVLEQLEDVFQVPVIEVYSLSETSLITCNPPLEGPRKVGSVGRPPRAGAASEVSIIDETGTPLPIGHLGEIVVKGPSVITAYDGNADINRMAFTDGWFHTGDQGYLDQDGYLYLTGRIKDLINRGGEKIAPQEVDNVLMSHAAVAEAATCAVPQTH
jgi:acyl-CoA synthetase (AMP-forming)/AMP-acid ligase II